MKHWNIKQIAGLVAVFVLMAPAPMLGQKKEILAAKDLVKAGKNLDQAESSMRKLLTDSTNRSNKKIWGILFESVRKQYEQGNEKLYLKQSYDTAKLFNATLELFTIAKDLDSVESIPDKKGKTEFAFRKEHAEYLNKIRPNLYNGGTWFIRKQKYADAYKFFDQYIDCASLPMFQAYKYGQKDAHLPSAAYWAVYCGYKMKDAKATLHHSYEALKDTTHYNYMLQYLAETYKLDKDTARYESTLREGFERAPKFPFFFPRLVEFYSDCNKPDSALVIADRALQIDPNNDIYLFTKGTILLNMGDYKRCIEVSKKAIEVNDSLAGSYYNVGLAYFNQAVELDKNTQLTRMKHDEINKLYKSALPYLEKYRKLAPDMQDQWALPLYTIYLNLNMGKEFDEIDKLINQRKK